MKTIVKYSILALLFYGLPLYSQKNINVKYSINPIDSSVKIPDSIMITYYSNKVSGSYGQEILKCKKSGLQGSFTFTLHPKNPISTFVMSYYYGKVPYMYTFYVEPLDHIFIKYGKTQDEVSMTFSGSGAVKYNVATLLRKEQARTWKLFHAPVMVRGEYIKKPYLLDCRSNGFRDYIQRIDSLTKSSVEECDKILLMYSRDLGKNSAKFLRHEYEPGFQLEQLLFSMYRFAKNEACKQNLITIYKSRIKPLNDPIDNPWVRYSNYFVFHKSYQILDESYLNNGGRTNSFKDQYKTIQTLGNIDLRDRLMTDLFISDNLKVNIQDFSGKDSCLLEFYSQTKSEVLKKALDEELRFNLGAELFDFSFISIDDRKLSLKDLKGKVFILDIWGNGCTGCARFHKMFEKELWPHLKQDKNFQFLSICLNNTKQKWLAGINSGLYSSQEYLNVWTGDGVGMKHSFIKFYNLRSIPFLLLVDAGGKIVTKINAEVTAPALLSMIKNTLNEIKPQVKTAK